MTAAAVVLPVGMLVGTFPGGRHEVQVGGRVHELTDAELAGWAFAHAGHGGPELVRHLASLDVPRPVSIVDSLVDRGLLVEVAPGGDGAVAFAREHRLVPTVPGLGNSPDEPHVYSIGLLGRELIRVDRPVFEIWTWGHVDGSLWRACEAFAEQETAGGGTDPELTDPAAVLAGFLSVLPGLLDAQAAYVDAAGPS